MLIETVGAGQNETKIREHVDKTALVLVPGMGDAVQMDKAGIPETPTCSSATRRTTPARTN